MSAIGFICGIVYAALFCYIFYHTVLRPISRLIKRLTDHAIEYNPVCEQELLCEQELSEWYVNEKGELVVVKRVKNCDQSMLTGDGC